MKKIAVIIIALICISFIPSKSNAQLGPDSRFGVRLGLNYSNIYGADRETFNTKLGYHIGLLLRFRQNDWFTFQPEINYTSKGAKRDITLQVDSISHDVTFTLSFVYLEMPMLAKINFGVPEDALVKPTIYAGPFAALKLASTLEAEEEFGLTQTSSTSEQELKNVKGFDYGVTFGGGVGFTSEPIEIFIDLRYTLSLGSYDSSDADRDLKHGMFSLSLGVLF
jgi:hypothetical protein